MRDYNYRITIQYDGSRYRGWQLQNNVDDTIQGKLEKILERMYGYHIDIIGSGRTDAGVHALGQVANFHLKLQEDEEKLFARINEYLPEDISVTNVMQMNPRFHARFSAISKTYRYRIYYGICANVFERKYQYYYKGNKLDINKMKTAAKHLIGEHDFMSFCGNKHMKKSTVRTIFEINIKDDNDEVVIDYTGDGFLQNMVRILTGTLIDIGTGKIAEDEIISILNSRNRENAGFTAPSKGLTLVSVKYK